MSNTFQDINLASGPISFPTPIRPYKIATKKSQSISRTLGGSIYVYDRSLITKTYSVTIPKMSLSVLNQINTFFANTTSGSKVPFLWTDHEGTIRTVKLQDTVEFSQYTPNYYRVNITLFEQFSSDSSFINWPYMGTDYVGTGYVQT